MWWPYREATRDQPKPLRAEFLFALRLRATRRQLGARWDPSGATLPFEPRPPMESGGHTPNIRSRLRTVSVGRARLISLLPLSERELALRPYRGARGAETTLRQQLGL